MLAGLFKALSLWTDMLKWHHSRKLTVLSFCFLFVVLHKVVLALESADKILQCDHLKELRHG